MNFIKMKKKPKFICPYLICERFEIIFLIHSFPPTAFYFYLFFYMIVIPHQQQQPPSKKK